MRSSVQHTRTDNGDETVLALHGVLDATSVGATRAVLDRLVAEEKRRIVLEISNLRLIDSTGVGAIVSVFKRLRAQGRQLLIVGARGQPLVVMRLLRLDRMFSETQANDAAPKAQEVALPA